MEASVPRARGARSRARAVAASVLVGLVLWRPLPVGAGAAWFLFLWRPLPVGAGAAWSCSCGDRCPCKAGAGAAGSCSCLVEATVARGLVRGRRCGLLSSCRDPSCCWRHHYSRRGKRRCPALRAVGVDVGVGGAEARLRLRAAVRGRLRGRRLGRYHRRHGRRCQRRRARRLEGRRRRGEGREVVRAARVLRG